MSAEGPDAGRLRDWLIPRTAAAVPVARHEIGAFARRALGNNDRAYEAALAASELLTNAVEHGRGEKVRVRVPDEPGVFRVEVWDDGGPTSPQIPQEALDDFGRGLLLVDALTSRWGVMQIVGGVVVWFEVDRT